LLGEVVARVSGQPYPEYLQERILAHLGMTSTTFFPTGEVAGRCAVGYGRASFADELVRGRPGAAVFAEGGLWSTVEDLSRWIALQLSTQVEAGRAQVLRGATLFEMHTARYLVDPGWTKAMGITWFSDRRGETIWVSHGGHHPSGYTSFATFLPSERLGTIVLVNELSDPAPLAVELGELVREAVPSTPGFMPPPPPSPVPDAVRDLLGLYHCAQLGDVVIRVEWRGGTLRAIDPMQPGPPVALVPTSDPDCFLIELTAPHDPGEKAIFLRGLKGHVCGVRIFSVTAERLGPVGGMSTGEGS
jgi:CubicO group peptidase (beta-lactamase class C family)